MRILIAVASAAVVVVAIVALEHHGAAGSIGAIRIDGSGARVAIDLDGSAMRAGPYPDARRRVVVSPDGRWRAVLQLPGARGNLGTVALGRNRAGGRLRLAERHLYAGSATVQWAPGSRWLALSSWVPHMLSAVAVSVDGRRRVLAAPFCGDVVGGLAWAPRGDRIAVSVPAARRTGCAEGIALRVERAAGSRAQVVARHISGVPSWSADGGWLATSGDTVEVMRDDGTRRRGYGHGVAVWSPRGDDLAIVAAQDQALTVGPPGGARIAFGARVDTSPLPAFSPDGSLLAYCGAQRIVVRRVADGRLIAQVRRRGVQIDALAWAHDGRSLIVDAEYVAPD